MKFLHNRADKEQLKATLAAETFARVTLSFYRYVKLGEVPALRDTLYAQWKELGVLGRIYLAEEGINAQLSVPEPQFEAFKANLENREELRGMPFKIAIEDDGQSFYKLIVRIKSKIVADGLDDKAFDSSDVGTHLTAQEFNEAMEDGETMVVDVRNYYESEVGHFEGAYCPDVDTFREELPMIVNELRQHKDKKVLLYCTGGIRCEKASAYL
jgi:UPF0176 protein